MMSALSKETDPVKRAVWKDAYGEIRRERERTPWLGKEIGFGRATGYLAWLVACHQFLDYKHMTEDHVDYVECRFVQACVRYETLHGEGTTRHLPGAEEEWFDERFIAQRRKLEFARRKRDRYAAKDTR